MFNTTTPQHADVIRKYPDEIHLFPMPPPFFQTGTLVLTPHDGRQYVLHFSPLSISGADVCGHTRGSILFSYSVGTNEYHSAAFDHAPHRNYLVEKLGIGYHEAQQIERALRFLFNAEDIGPFGEA